MKKILVALDFSQASKNAFDYALQLAKELKVALHVLHAVPPILPVTTYPPELMPVTTCMPLAEVEKQLKKLTTYYPNKDSDKFTKHNIQIQHEVKEGLPVSIILETAQAISADLILLGAKARTQIGNFLLGSVTADLITQTDIPVLAIPANYTFKLIKRIAYSTTMTRKDKNTFQQLKQLANHIKADLQPFFINQLPSDISRKKEENWTSYDLTPNKEETVAVIREPFVTTGIHYFLEKHPTQILAMFTPKRQFLEQLFHISVTQKMVAQTTIPLLIYRG